MSLCAAAYIATEEVLHILTPHQLPAPFTLVVLAVVIALKETLCRRVQKVGEAVDSNALKAYGAPLGRRDYLYHRFYRHQHCPHWR